MVADAFVLALFTLVGTRKALAMHAAPTIAVAMGVITGVAGGILRDLLIGEIPLVFRPQFTCMPPRRSLARRCMCCSKWSPDPQMNMIAGTAAVLLLRLAGIRWQIALPVFRPRDAQGATPKSPPVP